MGISVREGDGAGMPIEITSLLKQEKQDIRKYEFIDALCGIAIMGAVLVHASWQLASTLV